MVAEKRKYFNISSAVLSLLLIAIPFVLQDLMNGTVPFILFTAPACIIPAGMALYTKNWKLVFLAVFAGLSPVLLYWIANIVAMLLYLVSFGRIQIR